MMMSKQEIIDEAKRQEGDPHAKAARKRRGMELRRRRSLGAVATADVIVTNPTHFADRPEVHRGWRRSAGHLQGHRRPAAKIRKEATRHGVPIIENRPLARALYRQVPLGGYVPQKFFDDVVKVLVAAYWRSGRVPGHLAARPNTVTSRPFVHGAPSMNRLFRLALPMLIVSMVLCLVVPMPLAVLDILLSLNIIGGVVTLASVINVADPIEFSSYPSLLLVTTTVRIALTVSTTRSILLHADAGDVVATFGRVVVGDNVVVGLVMFLVLTIVNLVVITKGSERAAEVAARFSLDAMPGKQMAVDADLAAGLLDEDGARAARRRIARESDFYGAMDGAVKFVKGDAIAGRDHRVREPARRVRRGCAREGHVGRRRHLHLRAADGR